MRRNVFSTFRKRLSNKGSEIQLPLSAYKMLKILAWMLLGNYAFQQQIEYQSEYLKYIWPARDFIVNFPSYFTAKRE